ncbi:hypothetical protein BX281_8413 [Streptomyces sp. Ag82_O1-15]|uniref:hypothetical protein n=1 Tax=Streptomyces sp. Ag82_O1-15 TaxID=1938855 RepID=UPI000BB1611C|nr:hypothetical protein [Streptomyces sp. Ag82_O1-15]PBD00294.1 hypothetical protein BX281_8413 [Streptomyces sp. Ag82_O1-15]
MIDFDHDTGLAQDAVKAARRRRLDVPADIDAAAAMWQTVMTAAHMAVPERPTVDDIPATAEQLAAAIEERAHQHRIALAHQQVGTDFMEPVARKYNQLVKERVPGWILALQPEFNGLVKALAAQSKKLPAQLDTHALDWNDPKTTAAWEKAESAAHQLDQLVNDRKAMARAIGGDGSKDNELFAVAKLPDPTVDGVLDNLMRDQVGPALREWRDLKGQPVSRWLYLARSPHITLQLATPGEARERAASLDRWRDGIAAMHAGHSRNQAVAAVRQALAA